MEEGMDGEGGGQGGGSEFKRKDWCFLLRRFVPPCSLPLPALLKTQPATATGLLRLELSGSSLCEESQRGQPAPRWRRRLSSRFRPTLEPSRSDGVHLSERAGWYWACAEET